MGRDSLRGDTEPRSSPLPATYRNPWEALADDLRAVVADSRLRLQEFWRRNGEGDLWRPPFWPRDLAPLFWPLVVGGAVGLLLALVSALLSLLLTGLPIGFATIAEGPTAAVREDSLILREESPAVQQESARASLLDSTLTIPDVRAASDPASDAKADAKTSLNPDAIEPADTTRAADAVSDNLGSDQPPAPVDPLNQWLVRPEAAGLIEAVVGEVESGTLRLQLTPAFDRLSHSDQLRRSELWQRWATELGYDHLELRDQRSGLRGRDALVGDGMILFS